MLDTLLKWDRYLFYKINNDWTHPLFDSIAPWWRYQNAWLPLYLFLFLFLLMNYGWRIWPFLVTTALTITVTDQLSSHIIKLYVNKPRPCRDPLVEHVRLLVDGCPANPGFTSSHATNHFGIACLFYFVLKPVFKGWSWLWFAWAGTVSYAQIYIGIHFPLDVLGGVILGCIAGCLVAMLYNKYAGLPPLLDKPFCVA